MKLWNSFGLTANKLCNVIWVVIACAAFAILYSASGTHTTTHRASMLVTKELSITAFAVAFAVFVLGAIALILSTPRSKQ